jgi:hypothetical protein
MARVRCHKFGMSKFACNSRVGSPKKSLFIDLGRFCSQAFPERLAYLQL